ncbi:MAG: DUF5723 family protein [Bacteroidota bacterium]
MAIGYSQSYFGFLTENYSGINGVIRNPANIVDSRFAFDMNLAGASGVFANDIFSTENVFDLLDESFDFPDDLDKNYQDDNFSYVNADILGPSFLININKKNAIAFYSRVRLISNAVGNGRDVEQFLEDFDIETSDFILNQNNTIGSAHGWGEVGISYATVIKDAEKHFLKGGITLKYLVGFNRSYASTDNLNINYLANGEDFSQNLADGNVNVMGDVAYGASTTDVEDFEDFDLDNFELPRSFGVDVGFVYEWRPDIEDYYITNKEGEQILDPTKNKYKLRAGLSVTDIGAINYKNGEEGTGRVNQNTLDFISDLNDVNDFQGVQDVLNDDAYTDLIAQAASTPEFEDLVNQIQNANSLDEVEAILDENSEEVNEILEDIEDITDARTLLDSYNVINIDARTGIRASLPTALHLDVDWSFTKNLYLNLGTDLALASRTNIKTNSIANEVSLTPRYESRLFSVYSPLRIFQGQGVLWGLGLRLGPLYVGSGSLFSTLLSDEVDGTDVYAGLKVPILRKINRDKDGDGIKDKKDGCPEVAGPIENNGCPWPDTDGDTVTDNEDECLDTPGEVENKGCPWPDGDNDGVFDEEDDCPEVAGPTENNGCPWPDGDNDGVFDKDDECPDLPGTVANNGCPEVTEIVQKELNSFAKTILFDTGKTTIKLESAEVMAEIVKILNEYPTANFVIEGHTDSIGSYEVNQSLSERRAASVEQFLIDKGINPNRLSSIGYGETKPIATNMYKDGRKQNRRVEINLVK